jgi:hypothetical protein
VQSRGAQVNVFHDKGTSGATTPGRLGARDIAPIRVAFRQRNDVSTQDESTFAAQWLAYALPLSTLR